MSNQNNTTIDIISEINVYIIQYCPAIFQRDRFPGLNELFPGLNPIHVGFPFFKNALPLFISPAFNHIRRDAD